MFHKYLLVSLLDFRLDVGIYISCRSLPVVFNSDIKFISHGHVKRNILELQWLEHWLLVHHGSFELNLESLRKIPQLQIRDNLGCFLFHIDK